jgi:RHS repeat-associated protein
MQLALHSPMPDASPAVFAVNDQKPHQGVASKNPGLHRAFFAVNSTTALGVSWGLWSATVPGARVSYEYDAYGNEFTVSGSTPNNYLYRGEQYDSDLGLYYLRARYYNPLTGRFMSRDPENGKIKDPRTLHKYLYAEGDPVNRIDPKGKDAIAEYAVELGDDDATVQALLRSAQEVQDEVMNACLELNNTGFLAGGLSDVVAYSFAKELCTALLLIP